MATTEKVKPAGPFKLVTVNNAPERAKKICGRLCEEMRSTHEIDYVANTTSKHVRFQGRTQQRIKTDQFELGIDGVRAMVEEHRPDLMVRT